MIKSYFHVRRFVFCMVLCYFTGEAASVRAEDHYAAIAYSRSTGAYGYAYGYHTRKEAEDEALKRCDAEDAQVLTWGQNRWIALARASDNSYGHAGADTESEAQKTALSYCGEHSDDCEIVVSIYANHKGLKPARIRVRVPTDDTQIFLNGVAMSTTGRIRDYHTPNLVPGKAFPYQVKAVIPASAAAGIALPKTLTANIDIYNSLLTEVVFDPNAIETVVSTTLHPLQETLQRPSGSPVDIPPVPLIAP